VIYCKLSHYISGNPENKHVIIIDDLVQTGGTLKQCGKVCIKILRFYGDPC